MACSTLGGIDALAFRTRTATAVTAALSAIPAVLERGPGAAWISLSAIPAVLDGDLSGLDSLNAITTFFGPDGVFGAGGVDALLPSDTSPGYAALSAIPVFVGPNSVFGGGGVDALANYDALSALPVFVGEAGPTEMVVCSTVGVSPRCPAMTR